MKIIERPDTNWSYKCSCITCGAKLEVEKQDVKYKYYSDPRDGGYDTWEATCPCCQHSISIPVSSMSKAVQLEIKDGKSLRASINPPGGDFRNGPFELFYNK